jgi:hypothetical protein
VDASLYTCEVCPTSAQELSWRSKRGSREGFRSVDGEFEVAQTVNSRTHE